jgi:hypothetical protein
MILQRARRPAAVAQRLAEDATVLLLRRDAAPRRALSELVDDPFLDVPHDQLNHGGLMALNGTDGIRSPPRGEIRWRPSLRVPMTGGRRFRGARRRGTLTSVLSRGQCGRGSQTSCF